MLGHTLVVLADAHLGAAPPTVERDLIRFLAAVPELGDSLLINGDLFDFWFSYRRVIPRHGFRVAGALARLRERVPIVMIGGNHDRWDDAFWREDLGIDFAPDQRRFEIGNRRVLAIHGDGLTDPRRSARMLHWLIARRGFVAAFRAIHPDLAYRLVDRMAPHLGEQPVDEAVLATAAARQQAWADHVLETERDLDLVVMGHTHHPVLTTRNDGRQYLNPGAWFDGGRYAVVSDAGVRLAQFGA